MRITQVTTCMQYPGTEQLFTKVTQEARNHLNHWFLLPGGGLPVYIYICTYVYIHIMKSRRNRNHHNDTTHKVYNENSHHKNPDTDSSGSWRLLALSFVATLAD